MSLRLLLPAALLLATSAAWGADPAQLARGHMLVTAGDWAHGVPACRDCHAADLGGTPPAIPALTGFPAPVLTALLQGLQKQAPTDAPSRVMHAVSQGLSEADIAAVSTYIATVKPGEAQADLRPDFDSSYHAAAQSSTAFTPPPLSAIPAGPEGDVIWQGLEIMTRTRAAAGAYVGDALDCADCHVDQGRRADSSPMWAAYVTYPKYRAKNHRVDSLSQRIQDCFRYSMNGKPPAADSTEMYALVAYFKWLATGLPVGLDPKGAGYPKLSQPPQPADRSRGATVYAADCAMCHSDDGAGRSTRGEQVFPPLWGPRSFNWGAGMERVNNAAGFIQANMPYGLGNTLSLQQAWDVAAFMDSHSRPQDPRFTGNLEETRKLYHPSDSYYGQSVDGQTLGAPGSH
ncbi:MAG TPA: c-type cytochrome [Gammaproteobacteria bacterium]|jgi:thiosulfate dehydrogenase